MNGSSHLSQSILCPSFPSFSLFFPFHGLLTGSGGSIVARQGFSVFEKVMIQTKTRPSTHPTLLPSPRRLVPRFHSLFLFSFFFPFFGFRCFRFPFVICSADSGGRDLFHRSGDGIGSHRRIALGCSAAAAATAGRFRIGVSPSSFLLFHFEETALSQFHSTFSSLFLVWMGRTEFIFLFFHRLYFCFFLSGSKAPTVN